MKRFNIKSLLLAFVAMLSISNIAHAQYYQIANQLTNMLQAPLSGSMNYKGYVEASGLAGFGNNRANFVGISTSQGFCYSSWFYMGVGLGVDLAVVRSDTDDSWSNNNRPAYTDHVSSQTKAMIPLFTDFRFTLGASSGTSFVIGAKVGATWLMGDRYLWLQNGRLSGATQFYLKPSLGVRIPTSTNGRQAVTVSAVYQLITSNSNYYRWDGNSVSLNAAGLSIAYEW